MIEYKFKETFEALSNFDGYKDVKIGLSYYKQCEEAINESDEYKARELFSIVKKYYEKELSWLLDYERPYIIGVKSAEKSFWQNFINLMNSIPFYVLLKIGKSELVKSLIVTSFSGF